jgi:hypothetical protein
MFRVARYLEDGGSLSPFETVVPIYQRTLPHVLEYVNHEIAVPLKWRPGNLSS